ncbi:accessory Sec-dependent serine-rich glycoprotein adhesin [Streptococcus ilei]|uniref:accessory Sec-dependent serine-rich glycoprotein adhesin n=1 Tax=Streptococcus ilei TaxID=1156431 RepID=UPI0003B92DCB|nr:accessory Sec-dependent serine-rich glycoprotein adhesin [Streptococcus ilei]AGY40091.1 muramidase [Streptococcus ilei]
MIFKRSNGEFRETDRVTRFKLIKSGKNWLRAATSNFGLLKVIRGQVEETVVAEVREDAVSAKSRHLVKGILVAAAVLSATTVANTTFADEVGNEVVSSSTAVSAPSTSPEAAPLTEEGSKEVSAPQNETATETQPSAVSSSEVVERAVASDDKAILEQNASEAALLNQIAEKYASNHQNAEQKAAIKEAVAKVQSELPAKEASTNSGENAPSYAEQRSRLNKSVDDMMETLKAAGFNGNTTVNGAPAISAQLAPISTSTSGSVATNPVISDANGATIEDAAFNKAGYALDPNADRFTFGVWQFLKTNHATGAKTNFDYYATLAVDRSAITGSLSTNPDVYLRIVKKSDGSEVYTRTLKAGESNISLPSYITNNNSDVTNTLTYAAANGTNPGNVTFSLVNANLEYETLQIRDTNYPGNEGEDKQNVQTSVPYAKADQTTYYRVVDSSKYTEGQPYKPTGNETVLASYTQTGLAGQQFTASNNREIAGYKQVAATTDSTQKTSGILGKGVVGQKLVELQGGANHYYVKRISEIVDTDGSTVTKFYALDPSQVNNFATSDIGTEDVSKYTLIYTSKVNKAAEEWKADETKVTKVNSKNGDYYIEVSETAGSKSLIISGWSSTTETDTYKQMDGTLHTYPRPFKGAPSTSLTPAGAGNNSYNVIAGKVPVIQADGSVADDPTAPNGKVYSNLKGYASFSNNYSIPTAIKPSTDVNYYFVKSDVKGNVFVHYKDTEGTTLKNSVTDEDQQPINKHYDTVVDNRPQTIEKDGKTYELVPAGNYTVGEVDDQGHLKSSDPTTGEVAEQDKNVTYIYKLKEEPKGNVYVHYVDTEGKTIKSDVTDEKAQPVDKDYDTVVDNRPQEIEFEGKTYKLVPAGNYTVGEVDDQGHLKSTDPTTGKVIEGDKNVTYVYKVKEEPKGNVYVHYVDTEGKTIKEDVTDEKAQPVDKDYDTVVDNRPQEIEFEGKTYELVPAGNYTVGEVDKEGHLKSTDPTTGKVIEGDKNVTYVYKLKETPAEPKGNVYVHYVDTEGKTTEGKTIKSDVTDEEAQTVGKDYDTVVDNRPQEIEFEGKTYELVPAGNYTVGEVDDQGHLKSTDPTTGKVIEGDKNVTYVYKLKETPAEPKKGEVVITYVDENGKEIEKPRQDTPNSPYDTPYNTTEEGEKPNTIKTPDGKTYKIVPKGDYPVGKVDEDGHLESSDPVKGKVDKPKSTITYVYKEVKGNVYVHYVDTEGKTIKSDVTDEEAQTVGKDYDTVVDNRPQEIEFEGKTYELVPAGNYTVGEVDDQGHLKSTDPTTGKVIEGDKNVTYVYKLKETPAEPKKGEVVITYVDENGKEIEKPRQDTPNSPYDTPYNTTEEGEKPNTIKTPDGKTYKIVPKGDYPVGKVDEDGHLESSDPVKGKVDKPKSTITYVYKEVKGNVYVHYVDTEGKTIKSDVTDEEAQTVGKDYDTVVDNRPQEIEFEGKTYELVPAGNYTVGEVDDQGHLKSTDPTTGKVIEGDKNVTYVYKLKETPAEPKKGEVVITYVDENGKEIEKPRQDTPNSPYDTPYNTTEEGEKPNTIKTPDGKTYKIVPKGDYPVGKVDEDGHLESSDPVKGKVDKPKSTITYVYKEVKGNVYVHYVDTEGKTIKSDVTDEEAQPVDKDYDTVVDNRPQEIEFEGKTYELVPAGNYTVGEVDDQGHLKSTDPTTGKVIEGNKNVTYVYKLKETPDKPVEPTPDKPVEPTPDKPVEPTPDKPVEPTPDKPVEPTPDKPVEPTPDKPVEPTPDKPVEPTPDKPVEPTPDKPVEPTPDKPVEPTPDKPVEPTPDKPVEPTPDKPVEPTPDKPVEPTPDKPVEPTPDKPVNPTPDKPVDPTPDKPVNPTPDKPVDPTPGKPVDPTPGKPVNPTPGKPVDPTSGKGQLPNTGETTSVGSTVLGLVAGLVGFVAFGRRKKEDEK